MGLTGMGGGALMTPLLLLFKVQPLAAISSDPVAAVIMKPVGGGVHLRRGTVNFPLVRWLMVGSVPAAFAGVLILRQLGDGAVVQARIKQVKGPINAPLRPDLHRPGHRWRCVLPDHRGPLTLMLVAVVAPWNDPVDEGEDGQPVGLMELELRVVHDEIGEPLAHLGVLEPGAKPVTVQGETRIRAVQVTLEWRRERDTTIELLGVFAEAATGKTPREFPHWRTVATGEVRLTLAVPYRKVPL